MTNNVVQVENFYNSIDEQMLECQKLMMLDSAVSFEETIKNPKPGVKGKGSKVQVREGDYLVHSLIEGIMNY